MVSLRALASTLSSFSISSNHSWNVPAHGRDRSSGLGGE
jgi:hypothetical protein